MCDHFFLQKQVLLSAITTSHFRSSSLDKICENSEQDTKAGRIIKRNKTKFDFCDRCVITIPQNKFRECHKYRINYKKYS